MGAIGFCAAVRKYTKSQQFWDGIENFVLKHHFKILRPLFFTTGKNPRDFWSLPAFLGVSDISEGRSPPC